MASVTTPLAPVTARPDAAAAERPAIGTGQGADESIRPFRVDIAQADLDDLRRRLAATRWPELDDIADPLQGAQPETMREVVRYWRADYDWRRCEAQLNAVPNFITAIDGLDIHFIHVRSRHEDALPVILTHGWPGSILWMLKLVGPLTDPTAHGGSVGDAFDVVIPSMAGYGFSGKPSVAGWDCTRMARAWTALMKRLGYTRFVAQGGDWGAITTEQMGAQAPPELIGIHTNMPSALPPEILLGLQSGVPPPGLAADERQAFDRLASLFANSLSYAQQMANHPRALYGIADSPLGLAGWFLDSDLWGHEFVKRVFDGEAEGLTRDDLLDNITLTWLTDTAISGARLYRENKLPFFVPTGVEIPVAVSAFPDEIYQCPRSWAERAYSRLIHYNKPPKGGHFAPWEQPGLFAQELRAGFRSLR
jgi:pimeloyl-ACP methyl ester carboxylesterase